MEKFTYFWKSKSPFSQWFPSTFTEGSLTFTCAEQYMMHQKAMIMGDTETASAIMAAGYNPREYKALGRKVKPFYPELWEKEGERAVYAGSKLKFEQNPGLLAALLATADTTLVEASPYDLIWGIGLTAEDPRAKNRATWKGKNLLGKVLTDLRNDLMAANNA